MTAIRSTAATSLAAIDISKHHHEVLIGAGRGDCRHPGAVSKAHKNVSRSTTEFWLPSSTPERPTCRRAVFTAPLPHSEC